MNNGLIDNREYFNWLKEIKQKMKSAQLRATLSVNSVLLELYWDIGKEVVEKQKNADWGSSFIEQFASDLRKSFPDIKGFSKRNVYAMRQWYLFYSGQFEFVPQAVAQIPWGHNRLIISRIKDIKKAVFYSQATIENGWSRDNLEIQIDNNYFERKGNSITYFERTLPALQSDLAHETIKDPYQFGFLGLEDDALEKEAIYNTILIKISQIYSDIFPSLLIENWLDKVKEIVKKPMKYKYSDEEILNEKNQHLKLIKSYDNISTLISHLKEIEFKLNTLVVPIQKREIHNSTVRVYSEYRELQEQLVIFAQNKEFEKMEKTSKIIENYREEQMNPFIERFLLSEG